MNFLLSFWKSVICILIIVFLSLSSGEDIPKIDIPNIDKLVHFLMYFGLSVNVIYDFLHFSKIQLKHWQLIAIALIIVVGWGGMLEIVQRIPSLHRSSDFFDFLANTSGAIVGAICYKFISPLLNKINAWVIRQ